MTTDRAIGGIYKITEKLGEGGMGEVFKGFDTMLEREVAIKSLRPELCSRPDVVERFRNEAVAIGRMNHSNIATVYSFLNDNGQWFLVLEFVRGETLDKLLARRGALPWREAVKIVCQALEGLEHAHRLGVVHRDIKPANMILTPAGGLKLMDFGIARLLERARLTQTGHLIGTLEYMSPEQVQGKDSDARGDIYSMGIVLYELLTNHVPFQKDSDYDLIRAQVEEQPTPPTVLLPHLPKDLERVVLTALQKNPTQRYASAAAFQADLQGLLSTASGDTAEGRRTAAPETRFDIRNTGFTDDIQPSDPQTRLASASARPTTLADAHGDAFRPTSQADLADLTEGQSNTALPGAWERYRLWIVIGVVLLVTISVMLSLLLLRHDAPVAPTVESSSSPQALKKPDIKVEPAVEQTATPARQPAVEQPPIRTQAIAPIKMGPSALDILENKRLNPPISEENETATTTEAIKSISKKQKPKKIPVTKTNSVQPLPQQKLKNEPVVRNNTAETKPQPQKTKPDNNWLNDIHPVQVK